MNKILSEIKKIMQENLKLYLPHVEFNDLENQGAIFYMNAKNGTEFDWYVNDRLSDFMMFYNDKECLGAMKMLVYNQGDYVLYIYGEHGKKLIKEVRSCLESDKEELFKLAVFLKSEADDKKICDDNIERFPVYGQIDNEKIIDFKNHEKYYHEIKERMRILNLRAYVSKKIIDEGWKVGYMERNEPLNDEDSGWSYMAGNEDETYLSDYHHIVLASVGYVCQQLDCDVFKYIDMPIGTKMIRTSLQDFEIDQCTKEIMMIKR